MLANLAFTLLFFLFLPGNFPILYYMATNEALYVFISLICSCWFINKHITEFRIYQQNVQFFLVISDMFGSVLLYVNTSSVFFLILVLSLFCKSYFRSFRLTFSVCLFKLSYYVFFPKVFVAELGSSFYTHPMQNVQFLQHEDEITGQLVQDIGFFKDYCLYLYIQLNSI